MLVKWENCCQNFRCVGSAHYGVNVNGLLLFACSCRCPRRCLVRYSFSKSLLNALHLFRLCGIVFGIRHVPKSPSVRRIACCCCLPIPAFIVINWQLAHYSDDEQAHDVDRVTLTNYDSLIVKHWHVKLEVHCCNLNVTTWCHCCGNESNDAYCTFTFYQQHKKLPEERLWVLFLNAN